MSKQLDILALEPFFSSDRRNMLETLIRCSRHRWTLLKLPGRRLERRLAAAAHWFAEQLSRHAVGKFDLLFSSEALNLADLYRLQPQLAAKPAVVYFHDNQLPEPSDTKGSASADFANLNTAAAATEIWFNSKYHVRAFLAGVSALVTANHELAAQNPIPALTSKIHFMPPPVEMGMPEPIGLVPRSLFIETRGANMDLLSGALEILEQQGDRVELFVVGTDRQLPANFPRQVIAEVDFVAQYRALLASGAFVSTRIAAPFDEHAVRALRLGRRTALPRTGVYPELLTKALQGFCLYDVNIESLANRLQDALYLPLENIDGLDQILHRFDPIAACKVMDDRLSEISGAV